MFSYNFICKKRNKRKLNLESQTTFEFKFVYNLQLTFKNIQPEHYQLPFLSIQRHFDRP